MACEERYRMHSIYRLSDAQPDWSETDPSQPDYIKKSENYVDKWNGLFSDKLMEYDLTAIRFTFSLLGRDDYVALSDITWKDWIESPLREQITYSIQVTGDQKYIFIRTEGQGTGYLYLDNNYVAPSEKIKENGNYIIYGGG